MTSQSFVMMLRKVQMPQGHGCAKKALTIQAVALAVDRGVGQVVWVEQ